MAKKLSTPEINVINKKVIAELQELFEKNKDKYKEEVGKMKDMKKYFELLKRKNELEKEMNDLSNVLKEEIRKKWKLVDLNLYSSLMNGKEVKDVFYLNLNMWGKEDIKDELILMNMEGMDVEGIIKTLVDKFSK